MSQKMLGPLCQSRSYMLFSGNLGLLILKTFFFSSFEEVCRGTKKEINWTRGGWFLSASSRVDQYLVR